MTPLNSDWKWLKPVKPWFSTVSPRQQEHRDLQNEVFSSAEDRSRTQSISCIVSPSELTACPVQVRDHPSIAGQKASPKVVLNMAGFNSPQGKERYGEEICSMISSRYVKSKLWAYLYDSQWRGINISARARVQWSHTWDSVINKITQQTWKNTRASRSTGSEVTAKQHQMQTT